MTKEKAVKASNLLARIDQLNQFADGLEGLFIECDLDIKTSDAIMKFVENFITEANKELEAL